MESGHTTIIFSDYKNLTCFRTAQRKQRSDSGPVHSLPGPEPANLGLVQLSLAQTLRPPVRSMRARAEPQMVNLQRRGGS